MLSHPEKQDTKKKRTTAEGKKKKKWLHRPPINWAKRIPIHYSSSILAAATAAVFRPTESWVKSHRKCCPTMMNCFLLFPTNNGQLLYTPEKNPHSLIVWQVEAHDMHFFWAQNGCFKKKKMLQLKYKKRKRGNWIVGASLVRAYFQWKDWT